MQEENVVKNLYRNLFAVFAGLLIVSFAAPMLSAQVAKSRTALRPLCPHGLRLRPHERLNVRTAACSSTPDDRAAFQRFAEDLTSPSN
jgi:hypothetical protein